MKSALRIPLAPTSEQSAVLDGQSKILNWAHNHLLQTANDLRAQYVQTQDPGVARVVYTERGLRNLLPELKQEHPFLCTVHSSPLKNAALRLSAAIRAYQDSRKGKRQGKETGWPQFRAWKRKWYSLYYDEPGKGWALAQPDVLRLTLGVDATGKRLHLDLPMGVAVPPAYRSRLATCRVTRVGRDYFVVFTLLRELPEPRPVRKAIALDPNHKNLAYGVGTDGRAIEIANLPALKGLDRRIDQLLSRRDGCQRRSQLVQFTRADGTVHRHWEPSRRWKFFDDKVAELRRVRREQTKQYLFTVAHRLCKEYDLIAVGDYTPHGGGISTGMRRAMNNQSLIGRFKAVLAWVCQRSGKHFAEFKETGTTRTCSTCDCSVEGGIPPAAREWVCAGCGTGHIRDENAAINGLRRVLQQTSLPSSGHTPVRVRCTWEYDYRGFAAAAKELNGAAVVGGVAMPSFV